MSSPRPPLDQPVSQWISEWLPAAYGGRPQATALDDLPRLRLSVSGEGGGDFLLRAEGDRLVVHPYEASDETDVWVRMSAADLRAIVDRDADLPEFLPTDRSLVDMMAFTIADAELIRRIQGRIRFEITGQRRRRFVADLGFARAGVNAGRPRTTISIAGATFERVVRREMAPLQALLDGTVKIEGDRALASQLLLLMASTMAVKAPPR